MKSNFITILLCGFASLNCSVYAQQQWAGANDQTSTISRTGAISTGSINVSGNNSSFIGSDVNVSRTSTAEGAGKGVALQLNDIGSGTHSMIQHSSGGLQFFNFNGSSFLERMRISTNGNVGIGTNAPTAKLDIFGSNANTTNLILSANYVDKFRWRLKTTDRGNAIDMDFTSSDGSDVEEPVLKLSRSNSTRPEFQLYNNTIVANNGNVGIGTANPTEVFQIGNLAAGGHNKISIPGSYNFENLKVGQFGNGAAGVEFVNHTNLTSSYGIKLLTNADQVEGFQIQYAPSASSYGSLVYTTGFFMSTNGNVGVGTVNPTQKLTVNGTIYSKEVKVDLSVPGPDYVFEEDYNLPSLAYTENYIKQNKHLPEVPSACEMEENGINLSEMNMILLKKVEELTLYVIELKKITMVQQEEINILKNK